MTHMITIIFSFFPFFRLCFPLCLSSSSSSGNHETKWDDFWQDEFSWSLFLVHTLLTLSSEAFRLELHVNSIRATITANARPARRTTNIPPTFSTPSALALDSFLFSSLLHVPVAFHHLLYRTWIFPPSWSSRIASDNLSR